MLDAEKSVVELMRILWLLGDEVKNGNELALDGYKRPVNGPLTVSIVIADVCETSAIQ